MSSSTTSSNCAGSGDFSLVGKPMIDLGRIAKATDKPIAHFVFCNGMDVSVELKTDYKSCTCVQVVFASSVCDPGQTTTVSLELPSNIVGMVGGSALLTATEMPGGVKRHFNIEAAAMIDTGLTVLPTRRAVTMRSGTGNTSHTVYTRTAMGIPRLRTSDPRITVVNIQKYRDQDDGITIWHVTSLIIDPALKNSGIMQFRLELTAADGTSLSAAPLELVARE